jgi:hypothetical protein
MSSRSAKPKTKLVDYTKYRRDDMPSRRAQGAQVEVAAINPEMNLALPPSSTEISHSNANVYISRQDTCKKVMDASHDSDKISIDFFLKRVSLNHSPRPWNSEFSREDLLLALEKRCTSQGYYHLDEEMYSNHINKEVNLDRRELDCRQMLLPKRGKRYHHIERILRNQEISAPFDNESHSSDTLSRIHTSTIGPGTMYARSKAA